MNTRILALALPLILSFPTLPSAQVAVPERGELVKSMGQPARWKPNMGLMMNWDRRGDRHLGGEAFLGAVEHVANRRVIGNEEVR